MNFYYDEQTRLQLQYRVQRIIIESVRRFIAPVGCHDDTGSRGRSNYCDEWKHHGIAILNWYRILFRDCCYHHRSRGNSRQRSSSLRFGGLKTAQKVRSDRQPECSRSFQQPVLVATYTVRLFNVYLRGVLGYWLCMILLSECPMWSCINGSIVNLAAVTVDRYLKIVHPIWSRKWLRPAVIRSAMAFAWIFGLVYNVIVVFNTSVVVDGVCYAFMYFVSDFARIMYGAWYFLTFYALILVIFLFCYGRILVAIRSN